MPRRRGGRAVGAVLLLLVMMMAGMRLAGLIVLRRGLGLVGGLGQGRRRNAQRRRDQQGAHDQHDVFAPSRMSCGTTYRTQQCRGLSFVRWS